MTFEYHYNCKILKNSKKRDGFERCFYENLKVGSYIIYKNKMYMITAILQVNLVLNVVKFETKEV